MNVDWKYFSQTKGYKSLKEAYMRDARNAGKEARPMRNKEELYKKLQWVISRCIHYAQALNKQPWDVLDEWESKRDYWWLNYYQESKQPKIRPESISKKPMHIRGIKKLCKKDYYPDSNTTVNRKIGNHLRIIRTKKPRWTPERKARRDKSAKYKNL
ncbi:hypothetical protein EXA18_06410 [Vibrio cincinnatiensis]|uniref:hypothetical protein n=1 Tax=Vibrio cincinnatiensis TaxID=675 RepID=UPI001EDCD2AA|nr:hypothetical protein [Vibrio cincinnatiensis]MCG3743121.1 hypothetical protein [Vibrio cincinnatiensis]